MVIIKSKGSIEEKIRSEIIERAEIRRQEDIHKGLTRADTAQRGDFKECREYDKVLKDYRRFKDPRDRQRITEEYHGRQQERRTR
jgi:hypothetical protein